MATTWTQADIDNLTAVIASGVMQVTYAGPPARSIMYQSMNQMRATLAEMIREVNGTVTYRRVRWHRGFRD